MLQRAYSVLTIKSIDEDHRIIKGIATTPAPDRVGDIVEPEGAEFELPIPLLWQHDSGSPIGHVTEARVSPRGIEITAQVEKSDEPGALKDLLDFAWQSVKKQLVRGLSIGFKEIESARIEQTYSYRYLKWLWLELSCVTIPANGEASISQIKSIDRASLAATGKTAATIVRLDPPPGVTGKSQPPKSRPKEGNEMKTIAEQIAALEAKRAANAARMEEVMTKSMDEGRSTDVAEQEEFDGLESELDAIDKDLGRLRKLEKAKLTTAKPVLKVENERAGSEARDPRSRIQVSSPLPKGVGFVRLLAAKYMAMQDHIAPADIAVSRGWGEDIAAVLRTPKNVLKTAVTAASTTDSTWAGPLVTYQNLTNEFIELLHADSILSRIPGLRKVPFNVKVPRQTGAMTGYWVPQGSPKPLTSAAFDTVTLDFTKVAGITLQTQELLRFSQPNSEKLLVEALTIAINTLIDNDFLDPSKAAVSGESPASITNGTSAITASGQTVDAFRADFTDLLAQYTASNYSLNDLVLVMSQTQALRLGEMRNDFSAPEFPNINKNGGTLSGIPVITSENIAANGGSPADGRIIVALAANSILLADDGGVDVDISTEASLQAESAPDSPATASTVMISLWQRNLVGIRCERYVNWVKARSGAAVYISGANYG
jgi:HK97 family phage major capsid protein/HK97 family phage prohead protease